MDKATPTPSPASVDSVMALAEVHSLAAFHDGRNNDNRRSQKHLDAYDALRAEVERLAAQAAPTSKLHHIHFNRLDDALKQDEIKLLLEHGE